MIDGLLVDEVMVVYNLTRANVYVIAHRNSWRRWRDDRGRIVYDVSDVGETMARQAA
jgi:hypothetical protein